MGRFPVVVRGLVPGGGGEALGPQSNVGGILTTGDGGAVVRGTKELIKRINSDRRAENERKNITEVFEINEDESSII